METAKEGHSEEAYFCRHLESLPPEPPEDMEDFNDEKLFNLQNPEDQADREIYGEQYRHLLHRWP